MLLLAVAVSTQAEDIHQQRAHFNYQMFCQGCHTALGMGGESVPRLKDYMGHFLTIPEGREFLVRVPGSALSSLNNEQLAEVLNWMLFSFAGDSMPDDAAPYAAAEVGRLRQNPLREVDAHRAALVDKIMSNNEDK